MSDLKQKIYECPCKQCRALYRLIEESGAKIRFSEVNAGRLCELAVVAAEGVDGMPEIAVVAARRLYAKHLGVSLTGPTSNADYPAHIQWAVSNSNHNPAAKNKINLGRAKAIYVNGRFILQ
ncbi:MULTISPECIES: hypothetical protein [Pseudomonas]|uniref:hypothetical protein n=1 Tax=Pseudomonas TaxID=286 RepID=UPI0008F34F45|nr:hypothetical protein [Pseudomonas marincola]SFT39884.1 hypothetical protein SAMN05216264_101199 [Pseudomonas marincola]